ncbi:MAG: carbon monoxide dehydrogenase [Clostridia bacterium]|nr:carbon monoxide dehydrogenase [Clostridia bacterium]
MKLYDHIITHTLEQLKNCSGRAYAYQENACWKDNGESELVMLRDAAYELGGSGTPSVNYTCVTTTPDLITEDEIVLYGRDLCDLRGDVSFARITLLEVDDLGEDEQAYNAIRSMEFVRYHVFPDGYMVRVSSESNQEQVRVSKKALAGGIRFASVGNAYIRKYKQLKGVRHVRVIFLVDQPVISELVGNAKKVDAITKTLTHILDGLPTDCSHCDLKPVCDEVEGMRELHMGQGKKK